MLESWCEALNVTSQKYAELKDKAPMGCSPLFYGLKSGALNFEAYRKWVTKKYNIPFMLDNALDNVELLTQIQTYCGKSQLRFTQGHESIAFYKYKDIKYVACFYPEYYEKKDDEFLILVSPTTFEIFKTFNANVEVSEVYEFTNTSTENGDIFKKVS